MLLSQLLRKILPVFGGQTIDRPRNAPDTHQRHKTLKNTHTHTKSDESEGNKLFVTTPHDTA